MIMKRSTELAFLVAGFLLVCLGSLLNFFSQDLLQDCLHKQFILSETAYITPYWRKNPMKIYDRLYFFNWTNPSDLKEPGYKPKFEEVGPYSFEETIEKVNVVWNDNGTVTYRKVRTWFFRPEDSNGSLTDVVNTLNPITVSAAYVSRYWMSFARRSMSIPFTGTQRMYVTRTIGEITFEGYPDPILDAGSMLPGLANLIPQDQAGYFYNMNGSSTKEGVFNVETGVNGLEKIGKMNTWNYQNVTNFYDTPCGQVKGTAGELWPPKNKKMQDVIFFSSELCRYVIFKYNRTVTINGIEGYRYDPGPELYDNGTSNPENRCFCSGECVPSGALNVSACRFGSPAFTSNPHFYAADSSYRDAIEGMNPDPKKHEIYIVLEPTYGIVLEVVARLQVNMMVQPDSDISMYADVPRLFFPVFWMEQRTALPPHLAIYVKMALALPTVAYVFSTLLLLIGIIFFLLFFFSWIRPKYKKFLIDINLSLENDNKLSTVIEREVKSPLIKFKPKLEILPVVKESDI